MAVEDENKRTKTLDQGTPGRPYGKRRCIGREAQHKLDLSKPC